MALYGFKQGSRTDQAAISSLMSQADELQTTELQTLSQYKIKQVDLAPSSLGADLPRQWALTMRTSLTGFNDEHQQAIYFADDQRPLGDGYLTYQVTPELMQTMIQGGMYDNPRQYLDDLREQLVGKTFFRPSKISLTRVSVSDRHWNIAAGDQREHVDQSEKYLIGRDLEAYADVDVNKQRQWKSDLPQLLSKTGTALAEQAQLRQATPASAEPSMTSSALPALSALTVDNEVAYSTTAPSVAPVASQSSQVSQSATSQRVKQQSRAASLNTAVTQQQAPAPAPVAPTPTPGSTLSMDELMAALSAASQNAPTTRPAKSHAYVDDFATAKQSMQSQKQRDTQRRSVATSLTQAPTSASDTGLEL